MRFRTSWLARLLRGRRLDRNPLRRGSDRAETFVIGGLLAAFLAAAPFAAHAAGAWGHDVAARQAQAQRASLAQVTATLLRASPVLSGKRICRVRLSFAKASKAGRSSSWTMF